MNDDIIHVDDPRWPALYEEQCRIKVERELKGRAAWERDERNKHSRLIASIRRTWQQLQECRHPRAKAERVIPLEDTQDISTVDRCVRCHRVVGLEAV